MAKGEKKTLTRRQRLGRTAVIIGSAILSIVTAVTALAMVSYSSFVIYDSLYTNKAAFSSWDLAQYRPDVKDNGSPSFEELLTINPDTVAWLKIFNTNIDYPVVQGKDDLEYASKDVFGNNSLSGSIYLTSINTRDFTNSFNLIYGHHMENGAMFGDIEKYQDWDFFHTHQDGVLITTQGTYDLKIFARISTDAYDSKIYSAGDRKSTDFPYFLEYVNSLAIQWQEGVDVYDFSDRVQIYLKAREENIARNGHFIWSDMPEDAIENGFQLLALSTCADATTNGRQLLFATMKFRTEPLPEEMLIDDEEVPLAVFGHGQSERWSLLDVLCTIMCFVILLPGLTIPAKYGRTGLMRKANDVGAHYRLLYFRGKMLVGVILESGIAVFSAVWLLRTQSFMKRMTIVDKWTPLMLALAAASLIVDMIFIRYREEKKLSTVS